MQASCGIPVLPRRIGQARSRRLFLLGREPFLGSEGIGRGESFIARKV